MATPVGRTPRREPRVVKSPLPMKPPAAPLEVIDLEAETAQVREARPWRVHGQSAKTLVKHEHFRLVLVAMKRGRHCREHTAEESVSVQALDGHVEVHVASGDPIELVGGQVLALAPPRNRALTSAASLRPARASVRRARSVLADLDALGGELAAFVDARGGEDGLARLEGRAVAGYEDDDGSARRDEDLLHAVLV